MHFQLCGIPALGIGPIWVGMNEDFTFPEECWECTQAHGYDRIYLLQCWEAGHTTITAHLANTFCPDGE